VQHRPPGVVIGKRGAEVDKLRDELAQLTGKEVGINVEEIKRPSSTRSSWATASSTVEPAHLVPPRHEARGAERDAHGAQGIRSAAPAGWAARRSRSTEGYHEGRVPLHTLRADIDYAQSTARRRTGTIGVKVWIFKGERTEDLSGRTYSTGNLSDCCTEARQIPQAVQGRTNGLATRGNTWRSGHYGLMALEAGLDHQPADRSVARALTREMNAAARCGSRLFRTSRSPRAGRDPDGQGEGQSRGVGGGGESRDG